MNKKGFTLIELLATLIILGIVLSITVVSMTGVLNRAKSGSEDAFVDTLEDALNIYLDTDAKNISFYSGNDSVCTLNKTHGQRRVYKNRDSVTFDTLLDPDKSTYKQLSEDDFVNPNNKEATCNKNAQISIYRDEDYVYYYKFDKKDLGCLNNLDGDTIVTTLPKSCNG